jgi:hypothetical protein
MEVLNELKLWLEGILESFIKRIEALKFHGDFREQSDDINELATALSQAQGEFTVSTLRGVNPHNKFHYAFLTDLYNATRPALMKNNLSVIALTTSYKDSPDIMHVKLLHGSGQFMASHIKLFDPKADIETVKSYRDDMYKLAYRQLLGIACLDTEDDGEVAMKAYRPVTIGLEEHEKYNREDNKPVTITYEQIQTIEKELGGDEIITRSLLKQYHIISIDKIPAELFWEIVGRIREIKDKQAKAGR